MGPRTAVVQYIYPMANSELVSAFPIARFGQFRASDERGRVDFIGTCAHNWVDFGPVLHCGLSRSPNRILRQ
jgi:hypothetical protein